MKKETFIKLLENIEMSEIKNAKIKYVTERGLRSSSYGRKEDKVRKWEVK